MLTTRQTNPLFPKYSLLGAKELINENNNPFGTSFNKKLNQKKEKNEEILEKISDKIVKDDNKNINKSNFLILKGK